MLNKYTLQFNDKNLEQRYQEFQLQQKRKPLLQKLIYITFIVIIASFISAILTQSLKDFYITIAYLVTNLGLIMVLKYQPQLIRWILMIINYLLLYIYSQPSEGYTQYQYQISSALIVSFQFVGMRTGEFMDALVQVISFYSFYLIYLLLYEPDYSFSVALATFLLTFLLISTFYENAMAERSKFQLTIIDDKWEEILQNMIIEPCIIFNFNYIKSSFIFKKSIDFIYPIESTVQLKEFLRNSKVNQDKKINLEDFIYKKVVQIKRDNIQLWNQKLIIYYEKQVKEVYYSILLETSPIVLIKIKQFKFKSIEKNSDIENQYQYKYKLLIKSILLKFRKIDSLKFPPLNDIFKIITYHYLLEKVDKRSYSKIKIDKIVNQLKIIYPQKKITVENLEPPFFGQRDSFCLILIEVFEIILSTQIHIKVINQRGSTKLQIYGILIERGREKLKSRLLYYQRFLEIIEITDLCIKIYNHLGVVLAITYEQQSLDLVIKK